MYETSNNSARIVAFWVVDLYGLEVTIHPSQQQYHKTTTEVSTTMQIPYLTLAWALQLMCFDTQVTFLKTSFKNNMISCHVCRTL